MEVTLPITYSTVNNCIFWIDILAIFPSPVPTKISPLGIILIAVIPRLNNFLTGPTLL